MTVWRFVAGRLLQAAAVVLLVATLTFVLIKLAPGDPFAVALENQNVTEEYRRLWREKYGLDRPIAEQYARYLADVARGDFQYSFSQNRPVRDALADALPNTLLLMGLALAASFAVGIALGVAQARRRGSLLDRTLSAVWMFFYSMPDFWLALVVMLLLAYKVRLFPTGDVTSFDYPYFPAWRQALDRLHHLVLPVGTLTLLTAAAVARYQRAAMLDVAEQDFVRTARAKGVDERGVMRRHVLRNALLPVITLAGLALPALLGGAVFVESVFSWPGMGRLTVQAIAQRDAPLITASVIVGAALVSAGNLLADVLYALADPRVRHARR